MKKVLILTSSPRASGNSNAMASAFEAAAVKQGAKVTRYDMNAVRGNGLLRVHGLPQERRSGAC